MAAYRRVYGFRHVRAECLGQGSTPEVYARYEYRTTFTFTMTRQMAVGVGDFNYMVVSFVPFSVSTPLVG